MHQKRKNEQHEGPPGFHTTARELQTCTFKGPAASNTTKIPREDTQREKKSEKGTGRGEEKARNFGPPPSGPHPSSPLQFFFLPKTTT